MPSMHETEEKIIKAPFMASKKKQLMSDEELDSFYEKLREYYLDLPYDRTKVALEELNYRDISKPFRFFANFKKTVVLNANRIKTKQPTIYTSNHIGSYDQFYITKLLVNTPLHYLVKTKVTNWLVRWNLVYKPTGVVVVDTNSISSWQQAKARLIQYLLHGGNVFIFAEGSRRGEDNIGEFSSGVAQIAQESGVNVCTMALKNTYKLFSKKPIICAGELITVGPREDIKIATDRIKASVISAYNEIVEYERKHR